MMRLVKTIFSLTLLLPALSVGAQTDLSRYLETAAQNNPGLKSDFARYLAAMEKIPQVGTLPDPTAAFGYFATPAETRLGPVQARIALSQRFPWFGLLDAREDVAGERAKVLLERFEESKSKLFYEVKIAYFDLYFVDRAIQISRENLEILETFQSLALIKLESGKASAVDELRVEMDLEDLENEIEYLKDRKYQLQVGFNKLLNVDAGDPVIVPKTIWVESIREDREQLIAQIGEQNHSLRQIDHKIVSWEHGKIVAEKEGKVDFSIGLDYSFVGSARTSLPDPSRSGRDTIVFPTIGISIPLYRKKYRAKVAEASQEVTASSLERSDRVNRLRTLFEKGYKEYRDGDRRIALYKAQSKIANEALDLLLVQYSTDGSNFEEVLRIERRVLKYSLALDRARSDKNAAVAFIQYLLGN